MTRFFFNSRRSWLLYAALLCCALLGGSGAWAVGEHFTEYEYDEAGRLRELRTTVDAAAPVADAVSPQVVRRGPKVRLTVTGFSLRAASVTADDPGLTISAVTALSSRVTFDIQAAESAPLGTHTLTLSTVLGTAQVNIEVWPRLPVLQVTPGVVAVTPGGLQTVSLRLDSADIVDHVFLLSSSNPAVADVSPAAVTIAAGATEAPVMATVQGVALGTSMLHIDSEEVASRKLPLFVTNLYQPPPGGAAFYSQRLGVRVGESTQPVLIPYGPFVARIGVLVAGMGSAGAGAIGPLTAPPLGVSVGAAITGMAPRVIVRGDAPVTVAISGTGLQTVTGAAWYPPADVSANLLAVTPEGTSATVEVSAVAAAAVGATSPRLQ